MAWRLLQLLLGIAACLLGCDAFAPPIDHSPSNRRDASVDAGGFGGFSGFGGVGGFSGSSGFGGSSGFSGFGGDAGTSGTGGTGGTVSFAECVTEAQLASVAVPKSITCLECVCEVGAPEISACSRTAGCWELATCSMTLCGGELECSLALCNQIQAFAVWSPARFALSYCAEKCLAAPDLDAGDLDGGR